MKVKSYLLVRGIVLAVGCLAMESWLVERATPLVFKEAWLGFIFLRWSSVTVNTIWVFEEWSVHWVNFGVLPASAFPPWRNQVHLGCVVFLIVLAISCHFFIHVILDLMFCSLFLCWWLVLLGRGASCSRQLFITLRISFVVLSPNITWGCLTTDNLVSTCHKSTLGTKHLLLSVNLIEKFTIETLHAE